jgi:hypothetical protein
MTSDYKKYSLEKLQEWVHDAMNSDASPHEIYSAIREAVREDYYYHKDCISRASGLLELLSGHRPVVDDEELYKAVVAEKEYYEGVNNSLSCDKDDPSPECQKSWNDFWEEHYYPEEYKGSTVSSVDLKKEVEEIRKEGGYDWTPPTNSEKSEHYYDYTRNDPNRKNPFKKVKRWVLPVEEVRDEDTDKDEYCVTFPDDLLEAANLKEGDQVEWVDQGDGSYLIKKVPMTYDEMVAAGWTMTADGFWIKE